MQQIEKPQPGEYAPYAIQYIGLLPDDGDVLKHMLSNFDMLRDTLDALSEEELLHRYAPGKWSIKEVLAHIIDAERIFQYRALRIARNDKTALPGFEENDYAPQSFADERSYEDIMDEYEAVRMSTLTLFHGLQDVTATRSAMVNNNNVSVRALAYTIAGHELHHINILRERYLNN
jgi:hypothetical protein